MSTEPMPELDSAGEETRLTRRAQAGDIPAFEALMRRHIRDLRAFVALRSPVEHLIDEVVYDTFVHAYHHLDSFTAGTALGAWLRAIAGNILRAEIQRFSRDKANKLKYAQQLRLQFAQRWAETGSADDDQLDRLQRGLQRLSDEHRQLIELRYREGLSTAVIAERIGRSHAWVRTTLFRIRQNLKDSVGGGTAAYERPSEDDD